MSTISTLLPPFALPALHADDSVGRLRGGSHRPARQDPRSLELVKNHPEQRTDDGTTEV
jgi:hypothetical protein